MKRIDIFCASEASTAICMSMDHHSSASSSTAQLGGRAIDRYNPIIKDGRRITNIPCTSQLPISPVVNPKPYHLLHGNKSAKENAKNKKDHYDSKENSVEINTRKRDFVADSSRYLLSDSAFVDSDYDFIKPPPLLIVENKDSKISNSNSKRSVSESIINPPAKSPSLERPSSSSDQVVVLRVSLHCKGCAGKVKKHLSKMEGVKSYNIDFVAKKVTIVGDVTPASVLASVSKVKNAQFWPENATSPRNQIIKK